MGARLYRISEIQEHLKLSRSSIARLLASGQLRSIKISERSRRITEDELERFIRERQAEAAAR